MKTVLRFFAWASTKFGMWSLQVTAALVMVVVTGCNREPVDPVVSDQNLLVDNSNVEARKANLRKLAGVLQKLYADPEIVAEVNAAIKSGYYLDERVALKDLLNYKDSPVYKTSGYQEQKKGARVAFNPGKFATKFLALVASENKGARTNEDYFNNGTYNIYWPYSENFGSTSQSPLAVPADEDTDMKNVPHPECGSNPMVDCNPDGTVTVDDYYTSTNVTHIIGDIPPQAAFNSDGASNLTKVWLGWVRCRKQYDKLISFTGNGGGSELKAMRINGYLKTEGQQITTYTDNLISIGNKGQVSRKQIRDGDWVRVYSYFDTNWEADDKEQALAIFEEDTQGTGKVEGSITTKSSSLEVKPFSFSVSVQTQDEIPVIFTIDRNFLLTDGRNDQRHGFHDGWPIYDGEGPVSYTIPFEVIPQ